MRTRPRPRLLLALGALTVLTACGGGSQEVAPLAPAPGAAAPSAVGSGGISGGSGGTVLLGSVGTKDDPEAFEIALTTEDGKDVSTLAPGHYVIRVSDPARIHNFALEGPGVDQRTGVGSTGDTVFDVQLVAGSYRYECEPHASSMNGTFTVA